MSQPHPGSLGLALTCTVDGALTSIVRDDLRLVSTDNLGGLFIALLDRSSIDKGLNFLREVRDARAAFDWELNLRQPDSPEPVTLHFAGARVDERLLLVAAPTTAVMAAQFMDDLLRINNEQTNTLRHTLKEQVRQPTATTDYLEELSRLNNELICAQREAAKAHVALVAERERYRGLVENTLDWVWQIDQADRYVYSSPQVHDLLGYEPQEVIGLTPFDLMPPEEIERLRPWFAALKQRGERMVSLENNARHRDGRTIVLETNATPILDAAGQVVGYHGIDRDITLRKQAEAALRASEQLYHAIFARNAAVKLLIDPADGALVDANQAASQFYGYPLQKLLTMRISDLNTLPPPQLRQALNQAASEHQSHFVFQHRLASGEMRNVEVYSSPLEINGRTLLYSIVHDITARHQAEAALRESEAQYRTLFEDANDAIFLNSVSAGGYPDRILAVNDVACARLGYTRDELLSMKISQVDSMDGLEQLIPMAAQLRATGRASLERVHLARDGRRIPVEVNARQFELHGQTVMLSIVHDLTDHKQTEAALRDALTRERELNELKSRFVSMVSHEFRSPLTAIQTNASLVRRQLARHPDDKGLVYIERIQAAIQRMTTMLDEVLILGRAESGKLDFTPAPLDLNRFCRVLVDELQTGAGEAQVIQLTLDGNYDEMRLDETLLRHILTNLLTNAIKYSPHGGRIEVAVTTVDQNVIFRVTDRGLGIPREAQARLFETFYRANNVGRIQGTGLGLAIVKHAVDLHQGTITIDSEVGQGTTVIVTIPSVCA